MQPKVDIGRQSIMKDIESLRKLITSKLPEKYDSLLLTFYGMEANKKDNWLIIGDDYGTNLCLDLTDGHIQSFDEKGRHKSRFMNSSIDQLSMFIAEYDRMQNDFQSNSTEAETNRLIESFRSRLKMIDAKALVNPDNWWSTIIEQLEDGLL
jgi:hypothetical protein